MSEASFWTIEHDTCASRVLEAIPTEGTIDVV